MSKLGSFLDSMAYHGAAGVTQQVGAVNQVDFQETASARTPDFNAPVALAYNDGTNRLAGGAGFVWWDSAGAATDIASCVSASAAGATALVMTDGANDFTMSANTSYRYSQVGNLLHIDAYLQWTSKGSASGNITVPNFLPVNTMNAPANEPSQYGINITSASGIALGATGEIPTARISDGSRTLTFLHYNPNSGAGMTNLTDADFAASGIIYINTSLIVSQQA